MYQLDELLYQSFNMSDKDKMRLYRWNFCDLNAMNEQKKYILWPAYSHHEMTQQRPLFLQRILLPTKNFGFGKLLPEVCRYKYFYFFFDIRTYMYICIYVHICSVCQRPSFTYSKLWYLRYLTFWPEHHWKERKLKVSARHLTNITSPSNNEPGRTHLWKPSLSK